jgi:hypothetical protein
VPTIGDCFVQPINQHAFVVGLAAFDFKAKVSALGGQPRDDIGQCVIAVYFGLTRAEQVEIGAIEDQNFAQSHEYLPEAARGRSACHSRAQRTGKLKGVRS